MDHRHECKHKIIKTSRKMHKRKIYELVGDSLDKREKHELLKKLIGLHI